MNHLEKAVLDIIEQEYNKRYIGGLKVTKLISGYKLVLNLGNLDKSVIQISSEVDSEEEFLKFIRKELKDRLLSRVQYFKGVLIEDDERETYRLNGLCDRRTCS